MCMTNLPNFIRVEDLREEIRMHATGLWLLSAFILILGWLIFSYTCKNHNYCSYLGTCSYIAAANIGWNANVGWSLV